MLGINIDFMLRTGPFDILGGHMQDLGRFPHIYTYNCGNQYARDALAERKTVVLTFRLKKKSRRNITKHHEK